MHIIEAENLYTELPVVLSSGEEFGAILLPGSSFAMMFGERYVHAEGSGDVSLDISPWLGTFGERLTVGMAANSHIQHMPVPMKSTSHEEYITHVRTIIENCRLCRGKTVYSRVICGNLLPVHAAIGPDGCHNTAEAITGVTAGLFAAHPGTLRFIYHTPQTGTWLGATPELLLDFDKTDGRFRTMAFAGTRPCGTAEPWDVKNIEENRFVIRHIVDALGAIGVDVAISEPETVSYGPVEHLCVGIGGQGSAGMLPQIIDAINPTPALCGWPVEHAIGNIDRHETHRRGCYGGFIGINEPERYRAFVNLRCMQIRGNRYCIYGGGGITPLSDPETEFAETSAKTELLRKLVGKASIGDLG